VAKGGGKRISVMPLRVVTPHVQLKIEDEQVIGYKVRVNESHLAGGYADNLARPWAG
jgi:hypothetical protein